MHHSGVYQQYLREFFYENAKNRVTRWYNYPTIPTFLLHYTMLRTPLNMIYSKCRRNTRYSAYQKGLIYGAIGYGLILSSIHRQLYVPKSSIRYILLPANTDNNSAVNPLTGHPHIFAICDGINFLHIARRDHKITYCELMARTEATSSYDTIYRLLKEEDIYNWIAPKWPFSTPEVDAKC